MWLDQLIVAIKHPHEWYPNANRNINLYTLTCVNYRSLYNKVDELRILLEVMKPSILAVTETWLTESILVLGYNCDFINKPRLSGLRDGEGFL